MFGFGKKDGRKRTKSDEELQAISVGQEFKKAKREMEIAMLEGKHELELLKLKHKKKELEDEIAEFDGEDGLEGQLGKMLMLALAGNAPVPAGAAPTPPMTAESPDMLAPSPAAPPPQFDMKKILEMVDSSPKAALKPMAEGIIKKNDIDRVKAARAFNKLAEVLA